MNYEEPCTQKLSLHQEVKQHNGSQLHSLRWEELSPPATHCVSHFIQNSRMTKHYAFLSDSDLIFSKNSFQEHSSSRL